MRIGFWIKNARTISLPQSLLPTLTALAAAAGDGEFSYLAAALAVFGVICAHLGMNLADDWFDYRVRADKTRIALASDGMRVRIGKYPYLLDGSATPGQLLAATAVFLLIALGCGVAIAFMRGITVVWMALIGFLLGISYSGKPLRLAFNGLGELVIFLMFGPLLMTGVYFAAIGTFSYKIVWLSVAVGLLVANIIYTHSVLDAGPDARMHKRTMAHLMGSGTGMWILSMLFNLLPYPLIAAGVLTGYLHPAYLVVFAVLPMSVWLCKSMRDYVRNRPCDTNPKLWMGPMSNFQRFVDAGVDWFMIRWLISRNIVTFFCLLIIIVSLVFRQ
ncbi:MAG: prenyltransferase [Bacteroidales bacterium]|nr:prenyltransferase [Bacteroidales bacterium]